MRSLIIVALLAFLAIGFVAARPAEADETAVEDVADGEDTAASSGDEAQDTQDTDGEDSQDTNAEESTGEETEGDSASETEGDSANETEGDSANETEGDSADEESSDDDETITTTTAKPRKHVRPFWPRFGGHGPVVIRRRGLTLRRA